MPGRAGCAGGAAAPPASWNATSTIAQPPVSAPVNPSVSLPPVLFLYCTMQFELTEPLTLFASAVQPPAMTTVTPFPMSAYALTRNSFAAVLE